MFKARITAAVGAFALLAVGQAALAPAASAAPPSCLGTSVTQSGVRTTVLVFNGCSGTQSFKIAWDFNWDTGCLTLARGAHLSRSATYTNFEGLKNC